MLWSSSSVACVPRRLSQSCPRLPRFLSLRPSPPSPVARVSPLLVTAGVPAPSPPLSTLSHPLHSPTGGRVPRAPPCIWTASGLRAPPPCCRPAASPVVATHTRALAHSHTRAPRRLRVVVPGPAHPFPAPSFRPSPVVVGRLRPRAFAPLRAPGVVPSGLAPPLSAPTVSFLVLLFRGPSRPAVARAVCTVHAWSRFVSSSVWFGRAAHVRFLVMPCWLSLPCLLVVPVMPFFSSPCPAALPCRRAAPPPPPPRARRCRPWPQQGTVFIKNKQQVET